jgi:hypothetical protein
MSIRDTHERILSLAETRTRVTIARYRLVHAFRDGLYRAFMATPLKHVVTKAMNSDWRKRIDQRRVARQWNQYGPQSPMLREDKQKTILGYAERFHLPVFIETGTYQGDMVNAAKDAFQMIYSIELDQALFERARERFSGDEHIAILQGDSAQVLPEILEKITQPALFWLDGHYSGGETALGNLQTPVLAELKHILQHPVPGHVILIDDARCFVGVGDYPTLGALKKFIDTLKPGLQFEVQHDIIRVFSFPSR